MCRKSWKLKRNAVVFNIDDDDDDDSNIITIIILCDTAREISASCTTLYSLAPRGEKSFSEVDSCGYERAAAAGAMDVYHIAHDF